MSVSISTYNQILGNLIRKVLATTPVNDVNTGSVLLTLLEAVASNDFENNVTILNVLELLNIDVLKNKDLDDRAADFSLTRKPALKASGQVTINDSTITKRSTGLYSVQPAPIAGSTVIYVNDASLWNFGGGTLFIGRGTAEFEGPITYTSIINSGTFFTIQLASALQKDHLLSESVIDGQGTTDRVIPAGTLVFIPANNQNPEIQYSTLRDAVIPAGEDTVSGVDVIAIQAGSLGNAGIDTIVNFVSLPFSGATVTNTTSFNNGQDVESDVSLRARIKSYAQTLARGTKGSILAGLVGIFDPIESKQVVSAVITEPIKFGEPSILYIDDGTGFQPSYAGQAVDVLVNNATGNEKFFQLANFPLPRPQVVNTIGSPYQLVDGMTLRVLVDGIEYVVTFSSSQFVNIAAATLPEIVVAINSSLNTTFNARLDKQSSRLLIYPVDPTAETLQVGSLRSTDNPLLYANSVLKFPTNESSYISLFENSTRLREKQKAASLTTVPFANWSISSSGNLIIAVDGTPPQDRTFDVSDFGGTPFALLQLSDWITAFNAKFAGITAQATASGSMFISSNRIGNSSSLVVSGGSYFNNLFINLNTSSVGQDSQFELSRESGNLKILNPLTLGATLSAGTEDAKGSIISSTTISGTYNLSTDISNRVAQMVIVSDATNVTPKGVVAAIGSTITITSPVSNTMRIMSNSVLTFAAAEPLDFIFITNRGDTNGTGTGPWLDIKDCGVFKIVDKGGHTTAGVDSFVDVASAGGNIITGSYTVADSSDIKVFSSDKYPQLWNSSFVTNPPATTLQSIVDSINNNIAGVNASIFNTNSIKLTSTTENGGSIAIPVSVGNAVSLFIGNTIQISGNPPLIANEVPTKDIFTYFKRTSATNINIFLGRYIYNDIKGSLTTNATSPAGPYSEILQSTGILNSSTLEPKDIVAITKGSNKQLYKSIKQFLAGDNVGTQYGTPNTAMSYIVGDQFEIVRPLELSSEDSIAFVMDNDPVNKTINVAMARTGRVNSGSQLISFLPTTTAFSATDADNQPGVDFGSLQVWSTVNNHTNFADYATWFRARNWYATGGAGSGGAEMIVRAYQYGPTGQKFRFAIDYPTLPNTSSTTTLHNVPSYTLFKYYFGSGAARATSITSGSSFQVSSLGSYNFRYTWSVGVDLSSVQVNDVFSTVAGSGISSFNGGQLGIKAVNAVARTFDVYNPNGVVTSPGNPEVDTITTVADVVGSPSVHDVTTVSGASLDGKYFVLTDSSGTVAVWYAVSNPTEAPPSAGTNRYIRIPTVLVGDNADTVASKTAAILNNDPEFSTTVLTNVITVTNKINGFRAAGTAGTSGFTVTQTATGSNPNTLNGKYFIIYDSVGSVAVWFDVNNVGTLEPTHNALRSIKISTIVSGDSANTVASKIASVVNADAEFIASALGNQITITAASNGPRTAPNAGTSSFTAIQATPGTSATPETVAIASSVNIFPLIGTTVTSITTTMNQTQSINAVAIGNPALTIVKATKEEVYTPAGPSNYSQSLAYGHNPDPTSNANTYVGMYDSVSWVQIFQNSNPNFTLKSAFVLQGVVPAIYSMDTCPNDNTVALGEAFKLIPITLKNLNHHFTQKPLSQLSIIANIDITNNFRKDQIRSLQLGSAGAVEVIGGRGNIAQSIALNPSQVINDSGTNYLKMNVAAFPDTVNVGDIVRLDNPAGVQRLSRLTSTDTIDVIAGPISGSFEYRYNYKTTNFNSGTTFTISDVSASYGKAAGIIWRWSFTGAGTISSVVPGDTVFAYGALSSWPSTNTVSGAGDEQFAGLPIINVNSVSKFFDVVNPNGKAMVASTIGFGTVNITPTPVIKWNLRHIAKVQIDTIVISGGGDALATFLGPHDLNVGDTFILQDSQVVPTVPGGGIGTVVSVPAFNKITFATSTSNGTYTGGNILNSAKIVTRYRIESLGFNSMFRLSHYDGESPKFADCGVAVDDYIVLSGTTFKSNNNGRFRVLAVDNDSVIFINTNGQEELNTLVPFNNLNQSVNWTASSPTVTGLAGSFKNLQIGQWVKKVEDSNALYRQVIASNTGNFNTATSITLGGNYLGVTSTSFGIRWDEFNDVDKGVNLQNIADVAFYEGDSSVAGDTLFVQTVVDPSWFTLVNTGTFKITTTGTSVNYKPFLRVTNKNGIVQTSVSLTAISSGFNVTESLNNKLYSIRQVAHIALDELNNQQRTIFMTPSDRSYKFSNANNTIITSMGKIGFGLDIITGIDGYLYYTGLLRTVQRTIDGFEPDITNFPGKRAVGGIIEILPPLIKEIFVSLKIATANGVNLNDISNQIKSTILNYIDSLGVGQNVILSEIIREVQSIKGVGSVTFVIPSPSLPSISIAINEKAFIKASDISLSS